MMDKRLRSELVSETGSGNYKCALSLISHLEKFDEPLAIRVFVECCRPLCATKTSCSIIEKDLYNLLNKCVPLIEAPDENLLVAYLQSTYYIIKFLIDKGNVILVSKMEAILIPRFVNLISSAKTKKLYEILCSLIHNVVVDLLQVENKSGGDQMIYYFCSLSLKMKSNLVLDYNCLLDSAYSYFKCSNFTRIDLKLQYDCYVMVLNLYKKPNTTMQIKGCFSAIMRLLETVAQNLFKHKAFDKIKEYLKTSITTIKDICQMSPSIGLCCNILYITGELIIELNETEDMFELLKNNFSICFKHLKQCFENHGFSEELQRTSAVLYVIFRHLIESYIEVDVNVWNKCMTVQNQTLIYKLLSGISKMISKTEVKCVGCSNYKVNNLCTSVSAIVLIGKLLKKTLVAEQTTAKTLAPLATQHFEDSCTLITSLKHGNCMRWKHAWSEVAIMIYNIAVKLYSFKYIECSTYFSLLIRNIVQLEGVNTSTSVFNFDAVSASLKCLSDIYLQTLQFKEALMFSSLQILLDDSGKKFQQWISVKVKNKHSDIINDSALQEATVVCILEQNKNEIEKLCPLIGNRLDISIKQNLLMLELEQYKAIWPSRVPMMAVFKKLFEMADIEAVVKVLIGTWGDNLTSAHDGVLELLNPISTKLKNRIKEMNEDKTAMQIFMGLLHVMCYYYETRQLRQSTVKAIKKTIISEQLPALPHEVPKHPNDECDIISSYESLKIKEHLKVWKHLNKALRIFKLYTPHCTSIQLINLLKEFNVDNNIVKIAKEASLHCHTLDSMLASSVGFSVSKLIGNKLCMLQFLLPVIEDAKTNLVTVEQLLAEAEILASEVKLLDMSDESWQVLTEYYISKSKVFFRHHKFQKGFKEYERALSCFTNITENELLKVRLDLLYVQYLQLPCNLSGENHDVSMLSKFSRLFQHITYLIKHADHYSIHTKAILFEVNQVIIETYKWMNLPREVRCYSRNLITCAQEEVVPLRAAQLLAYLIHADLLSMRLDDCQVKLSGLAEILCLDNNKSSSSHSNLEKQNSVKEDNDMMSLINDFAEVMLDCPANDTNERNLTGSPILLTKPFKLPSFLNHSLECDCFYCTSIEYKYLVMEYIQLEAQLHIQYNNMTAAVACFQGAMLFYKKMNNRNETFKMHLINCFSYDPLCDMKDLLAESFSSILLSYVNYLISINDIHKAKFFNEQLTRLINDKKYKNPHLYNKAFAQKLIIMYTISDKMNDEGCLLFAITSCMKPNKISNELKTPENRQTKITVQSNYSPIATPPPKRQLRKIKCDFSEKKRECKDKCNTPTSNNNQPFEIEVCSETEKSDECGTHKPSNKLVYKTPIIKSVSTKETVLQEIPISVGKNNNCIKQRDSSGVIPESPNAYTPKVIMVSSVLESRTKLLTKKLNKKKIINDGDDTCEVNINKDKNKTKNDIRKNLMDELSATENNAVGKCTNKKRCNVQESDGRDTSRIPVKTRTRTKKNK